MADDIVVRLRKWADAVEVLAEDNAHRVEAMMYREAADEIERLRLHVSGQMPCDVRLPPRTTIAKGCQVMTLLAAIDTRRGENVPPEALSF